jgi:hypothetical protein
MDVKTVWTADDFDEMTWHDNYIHSIFFPGDDLKLKFDIDYVFRTELDKEKGNFNYWIAPCLLVFLDVLKLKIDIDFKDSVGIDINNISRFNSRASPNGMVVIWDYMIETEKGKITFESTGYVQKLEKQPIFSDSLIIPREVP